MTRTAPASLTLALLSAGACTSLDAGSSRDGAAGDASATDANEDAQASAGADAGDARDASVSDDGASPQPDAGRADATTEDAGGGPEDSGLDGAAGGPEDAAQGGTDADADTTTPECSQDEIACAERVPLTCESGRWVAGTMCQFACVAGECTGSCVPEDRQCTGNQAEVCDATGTWDTTLCEGGTPECTAGSCTCGATTCGDECVDLETNADHCGRCGRSCGDEACDAAACDAGVLHTRSDTIDSLTLASPFLYFIDDAGNTGGVTVYRLSTGGGSTSVISYTASGLRHLVADGSYLYGVMASNGTTDDTIGRMPILGDGFTTLQGPSGSYYAGAVRTNSTHVFVASTLSRSYIERVSKTQTGQTREPVTSAINISYTEFEVDDSYVYVIDSGAITRVVAAGGDPEVVMAADAGESVADIALSGGYVVFASNTRVGRVDIAGGTPTDLGGEAYAVVADATYAYYFQAWDSLADCSSGSLIYRVPVEGGTEEIIGVDQAAGCARSVVHDDDGLYWLSDDRLQIRTLPK